MKILDGLDLANQQLKNLADGSSSTDAVTLQQLQAYVRGLDWKASVRAASTANVNVASPGTSLDGVTLAANDRVLLKNQTTASENGIYVWTASGSALTRATDASSTTLTSGAAALATEGTVNADTAWVLTTHDPITVGTTSLTFAQFGGGTQYTAGNGIDVTGSTISVKAVSGGGISVVAGGIQLDYTKTLAKYSASIGDASTTTFTVTHGLGTTDVHATIKDNGNGEIVGMKIVVADANSLTLVFPTAPTSNQYRVTVAG
jgi:phage-related tail fiber protein